MQCIIIKTELSSEMTSLWPPRKHFTPRLTDSTRRLWQKFNGVCIFRHRIDVRYDMCCILGVQYAFGRREHVRSRSSGLYVTCENERGELLHDLHEAREHRPPTKEKDEMQMMKVAIIEKHLGNLSVDRLQVPHWQDGEGAEVAGRRGKKIWGRGVSERARRQERLKRRGESGTGPSAV